MNYVYFKEGNKILQARADSGIFTVHTRATFQAFVHALIPSTSAGIVQGAGALDIKVYEYVIRTLDHSLSLSIQQQLPLIHTPMSIATARLLDAAAIQLVQSGQAKYPLHAWIFPGGGPFASLLRSDRIRAMDLLERLEINLGSLPPPYQNNPGLIQNMMDALSQLTMFGYYSEWTAYGTTRLLPPDYRQVEYVPISWIQCQYPGPAFGYRDLRGFLADFPQKRGKS